MLNVPWYSHLRIFRELQFELSYTLKSPLRIGSRKGVSPTSPIDLPVITINYGGTDTPYIPGSSLKGVFRSASEFVARSSNIKNICQAGEECKQLYSNQLKIAVKGGNVSQIEGVLRNYCLICKLYGSAGYLSHIFLGEAYPEDPSRIARGVKTGIAIDRRSGKVRRGALYTVEYVEPGCVFKGTVTFKNIPNYGLGLFSTVLRLINVGLVKIGGFKSRGFGTVEIHTEGVSGIIYSDEGPVTLSEISKLEPLDKYDTEIPVGGTAGELLKNSIKAWDEYVKRAGKGYKKEADAERWNTPG